MDKKHWEEFVIRLSNVWWFPEGEHQEQLDQGCGPGQDNITPSPENTKFSKLSCKLDSDKWFTEIKVDTLPLLISNVPSLTVNLDPNIEATPTFDDAESWSKDTAIGFHFIKTSIYWLYYLQPKGWKTTKASSWFMHLLCTQFPVVKLTTSLLSWLPEAVWGHTELVREYYWYWHYLLHIQCTPHTCKDSLQSFPLFVLHRTSATNEMLVIVKPVP